MSDLLEDEKSEHGKPFISLRFFAKKNYSKKKTIERKFIGLLRSAAFTTCRVQPWRSDAPEDRDLQRRVVCGVTSTEKTTTYGIFLTALVLSA